MNPKPTSRLLSGVAGLAEIKNFTAIISYGIFTSVLHLVVCKLTVSIPGSSPTILKLTSQELPVVFVLLA